MLTLIAAAGLALSMATAPATAPASSDPPNDRIVVDVETVNGSGCSPGTAAVAVSSDNTAFTVTYSDYLAQIGPGAAPIDFRKNCQLNLVVHVPHGFTYAIAQADYRGFAHLAKGARGYQQAGYYIQGTSPTSRIGHNFDGPHSDNWQTTDRKEVHELVFAPCGEERSLNINTELRVYEGSSDADKNTSFMTMDSTDGSVNTEYHFAWKKCKT
ncbi:DUF4360 domain-containing protein [Amycolatopsis cihanbeyliensis]|uniref:Uncharacterized protein DUF4360 n=1 Tax=Amycolatopsis cihanbeyliensis TaxID=1128664 RepID=A0A542CU78_AMYCI|nr:DUF4360 domain-containing protein [Amycolatopsis cihanbeyliensis]TQI94375.1 uncharacterized protein DUF4360 [Amycolatopsis cihanbeyliensis]